VGAASTTEEKRAQLVAAPAPFSPATTNTHMSIEFRQSRKNATVRCFKCRHPVCRRGKGRMEAVL
jgi:hypothetical protein